MRKVLIVLVIVCLMTSCASLTGGLGYDLIQYTAEKEDPNNGHGIWRVYECTDEFFNPTGEYKLVQEFQGWFSDSATKGDVATGRVWISKDDLFITLYKYDQYYYDPIVPSVYADINGQSVNICRRSTLLYPREAMPIIDQLAQGIDVQIYIRDYYGDIFRFTIQAEGLVSAAKSALIQQNFLK